MVDTKKVKERLPEILRESVQGFIGISKVERITEGANSINFKVVTDYETLPKTRVFCLRLEDRDSKQEKSSSMKMEADIINTAQRHRVPVPKVIVVVNDEVLGTGLVTAWLEGITLGKNIVDLGKKMKDKKLLAMQCGRILADIHSIDYKTELSEETINNLEKVTLEETILKLERRFRSFNLIRPSTEYIIHWCLVHCKELDSIEELCLVHGDFRNGNLMMNNRGVVGVLDWELCHIGSAYSDLAYLCINSWRFNNHEKAVGGFGDKVDLIDSYVNNITRKLRKGFNFDKNRLRIWSIVCSLKWAIICLSMGCAWQNCQASENMNVSMERAIVARRATEAETDCIRKIFDFSFSKRTIPARLMMPSSEVFSPYTYNCLVDLHFRRNDTAFVSSIDLMSSVQQYLSKHLKTLDLSPDMKYLSLVSRNALNIVKREVRMKDSLDRWERERLLIMLCDYYQDKQLVSCNELRDILISRINTCWNDNKGEYFLIGYHVLLTLVGQMEVDQPEYGSLNRAKKKLRLLFSARAMHSRL